MAEPEYASSANLSNFGSGGSIVMNDERGGLFERLFAIEQRFYDSIPVKNAYSKLVLRTFVWFFIFWTVYYIFTSL